MGHIHIHHEFSGHFALASVNKKTGKVNSVGYIEDPDFIKTVTKPESDKPFDNLLTDGFLDYVGTKGFVQLGDWWVHVGTGATAPTNSDTSLETQVAKSGTFLTVSNTYVGSPDYYWRRVSAKKFPIGTFSGENLSEIGISDTGNDNALISRALILDSGGSPTTLTVTADDELRAYWELRKYIPTADGTGSFTETELSKVHNYTIRAAEIDSNSYWEAEAFFGTNVNNLDVEDNSYALEPIEDFVNNNGFERSTGNGTANSYSNGTHQRTYSFDFDTTDGNVGGSGIGYIFWEGAGGAWQIKLDPGEEIAKNGTNIITGFNITCSWGRKS